MGFTPGKKMIGGGVYLNQPDTSVTRDAGINLTGLNTTNQTSAASPPDGNVLRGCFRMENDDPNGA